MKRILVVDIGNTSITFALSGGSRISSVKRLPTKQVRAKGLRFLKGNYSLNKIDAVVIASVVPQAGAYLRRSIPKNLKIKTLLLGRDLPAPVRNGYRDPKQVGMDRLMNAVAVLSRHPTKNAIVVDFGTAITFDAVSATKGYLGGVIAPGIEISLEALFQRTALLPKAKLTRVSTIIGRDTVSSIRSGCCYGIGGLCDRIIAELKSVLGSESLVVATGGYARFMASYCRSIRRVDANLVLKGIIISYQKFLDKK